MSNGRIRITNAHYRMSNGCIMDKTNMYRTRNGQNVHLTVNERKSPVTCKLDIIIEKARLLALHDATNAEKVDDNSGKGRGRARRQATATISSSPKSK